MTDNLAEQAPEDVPEQDDMIMEVMSKLKTRILNLQSSRTKMRRKLLIRKFLEIPNLKRRQNLRRILKMMSLLNIGGPDGRKWHKLQPVAEGCNVKQEPDRRKQDWRKEEKLLLPNTVANTTAAGLANSRKE